VSAPDASSAFRLHLKRNCAADGCAIGEDALKSLKPGQQDVWPTRRPSR